MKKIIKINSLYLSNLMKKLLYGGVLISVLIFFGLDIDISYRYFISVLLVFVGLLYVFYLNKNFPEYIDIQDDQLKIAFSNKMFFKKGVQEYKKEDISLKEEEDLLLIYNKNELVAKIDILSFNDNDLCEFRSYFSE